MKIILSIPEDEFNPDNYDAIEFDRIVYNKNKKLILLVEDNEKTFDILKLDKRPDLRLDHKLWDRLLTYCKNQDVFELLDVMRMNGTILVRDKYSGSGFKFEAPDDFIEFKDYKNELSKHKDEVIKLLRSIGDV